MYNNINQKLLRKIALGVGIVIVLIISSFIWFITARVGLVQVEAIVVPSDSTVSYEHGTIKNGINYIRPGVHEVTISRDNFQTRTYDITVTTNTEQIPVSTSPANDNGNKYLEENPDENHRYEILGATMLRKSNNELINNYPRLADLPKRYFSRTSVYTISSGGATTENVPILVITNSSTQGRKDALRWIHDNGFDINSIVITYDGYDTPINKRSSS